MEPEKLRQWMAANGYTPQPLADKLGVSRRQVDRWLTGASKIDRRTEFALKHIEQRAYHTKRPTNDPR